MTRGHAPSELVQAIAGRWNAFWSTRDTNSAEDDGDTWACLSELAATFGPDVQALGPAHVMAAVFIEQWGKGLSPGVESATAFVWTRMATPSGSRSRGRCWPRPTPGIPSCGSVIAICASTTLRW